MSHFTVDSEHSESVTTSTTGTTDTTVTEDSSGGGGGRGGTGTGTELGTDAVTQALAALSVNHSGTGGTGGSHGSTHTTDTDTGTGTGTGTDAAVAYASQLMGYVGWRVTPTKQHLSPELTAAELFEFLQSDVAMGIAPSEIAAVLQPAELPPIVKIRPFDQIMPAEAKPNLLVASCMLVYGFAQEDISASESVAAEPASGAELDKQVSRLLAQLNDYHFILPRNPLKKIMSHYVSLATSSATSAASQSRRSKRKSDNDDGWRVLACRPYKGSPVFIDRSESYDVNLGAKGLLFEAAVTRVPVRQFHRVYGVNTTLIDEYKLGMTGEVDCVDRRDGKSVEIKCSPMSAKSQSNATDVHFKLKNWIQSTLTGTSTIVTGYFIGGFGRSSECVFRQNEIHYQTLETFGAALPSALKNGAMCYGKSVLAQIDAACQEVGVVYSIRSSKGGEKGDVVVQRSSEGEQRSFPITEAVLKSCAQACIKLANQSRLK